MHEHFSWMKWNSQYTTNTHMIENISFSSKQHENLPMSQFSSGRTLQWISQKAMVVGCLIFSINIGHGMAIVPYNDARSSHSRWTLAQTIGIKIFALHSWNYTSNSCQPGNSLSPQAQERTCNRHQISARVTSAVYLNTLTFLKLSCLHLLCSIKEFMMPSRHNKKITLPKLHCVSFSVLKYWKSKCKGR